MSPGSPFILGSFQGHESRLLKVMTDESWKPIILGVRGQGHDCSRSWLPAWVVALMNYEYWFLLVSSYAAIWNDVRLVHLPQVDRMLRLVQKEWSWLVQCYPPTWATYTVWIHWWPCEIPLLSSLILCSIVISEIMNWSSSHYSFCFTVAVMA